MFAWIKKIEISYQEVGRTMDWVRDGLVVTAPAVGTGNVGLKTWKPLIFVDKMIQIYAKNDKFTKNV